MIQPVKEKIILGIDPGTTIMGYGVLRVKGTKPEMIAMGIIDLRKFANHYLKLRHIHERVLSIIESYLPDELAIEAPFFGKNVQSMLKLGRAQGVATVSYTHLDVYKRQGQMMRIGGCEVSITRVCTEEVCVRNTTSG